MGLIDLDEFLRENCIDRMEGKSCEECKHHVLVVSCERLREQPTAERVGKWMTKEYMYGAETESGEDEWVERPAEYGDYAYCSVCGESAGLDGAEEYKLSHYCPNCGARMEGEEDE